MDFNLTQTERPRSARPSQASDSEQCPDCGTKLWHESGCAYCPSCGFSECSYVPLQRRRERDPKE